jgi:hypothetical protein
LHIGAGYTVTEAATVDYTPSVDLTVNGVGPTTTNGTVNTLLGVGDPNPVLIGENANSAAFTNTYKTVTPTGLDVDDLPFILMLVLVAGAAVAFVAVKYRRRAQAANR